MTGPKTNNLSDAIRNLIVCDTQFGWSGETTLKLPELLDLQARGWLIEGSENNEFSLTDEGQAVVERALQQAGPAELSEQQGVDEHEARGQIEFLDQQNHSLRRALSWYEEQVSLCRKVGSLGEPGRHALDRDGGERARAALAATGKQQVGEARPCEAHCQSGRPDVCLASQRDNITCPHDSCDIDDGVRHNHLVAVKQVGEAQGDAHVVVLREMRARLTDAGSPARTAALDAAIAALAARQPGAQTFQAGVSEWMGQCFLPSLYSNMTERGDRLLEEVLELLQAHGYDQGRVGTLVDYVFGRPVGEPAQEVGGVMVTLAGYCWVAGLDMHAAGDAELRRITQPEVMAKIRRKQEAKNALHFDTPLPGDAAPSAREPGAQEPVAWFTWTRNRMSRRISEDRQDLAQRAAKENADMDRRGVSECYRIEGPFPLYTAPPAQGIDLGPVREFLRRRMAQWRSHLPSDPGAPGTVAISGDGEGGYNNDVRMYREGIALMDQVLALIDNPRDAAPGVHRG